MGKAKKTVSKAPAAPLPQSRVDVSNLIAGIGADQRALARIEADLAAEVTAAALAAKEKALPLEARLKVDRKAVQAWCEARRDEITGRGKRKTVRFAAGVVRWRATPAAVTVKGVAGAIAWLKRRNALGRKFLRVKVSLDKEAMLKEPKDAARVPGVTIKGGEQFEIEPTAVHLGDG